MEDKEQKMSESDYRIIYPKYNVNERKLVEPVACWGENAVFFDEDTNTITFNYDVDASGKSIDVGEFNVTSMMVTNLNATNVTATNLTGGDIVADNVTVEDELTVNGDLDFTNAQVFFGVSYDGFNPSVATTNTACNYLLLGDMALVHISALESGTSNSVDFTMDFPAAIQPPENIVVDVLVKDSGSNAAGSLLIDSTANQCIFSVTRPHSGGGDFTNSGVKGHGVINLCYKI